MNKQTIAPKRWWYIIPIIFITYSLAYLDRANFSFASAAGINEDLGITKGMSSLLGALFFLGYFFFQIPGAVYAERRSVKKLVFCCLVMWGVCASLTGVVSNIPMLAAIRFILGVVEAAVMPAMLIYISNWFTKSERSRANTFLILGNPVTVLWMSVVSGYLINAFGWREMFIFEGIPAVIWAVFWWFLVQDKPAQARWLSEDEKTALQEQLRKEQEGIKAVRNYREAFKSRNVILLCMQYFAWSIGVYGFVLWLPSILRNGTQMGMVEAGWLFAETGARRQAFAVADHLNRQRADFIAATDRLRQWFAFQQRADHANGEAVARADGIDDIFHPYRLHLALVAVRGFVPGAIAAGFDNDRFHPFIEIEIGDRFRLAMSGQNQALFFTWQHPVRHESELVKLFHHLLLARPQHRTQIRIE